MSRSPKWIETIRDLNLSLVGYLQSVVKEHENIMVKFGNGAYHRKDGIFIKENMELRDKLTVAHALAQEVQSKIEDNDKTFAENEKRIFARFNLKEKTR